MVDEFICSFCGKDVDGVDKMIVGITGCICNKCVDICVEILEEPDPFCLAKYYEEIGEIQNLGCL